MVLLITCGFSWYCCWYLVAMVMCFDCCGFAFPVGVFMSWLVCFLGFSLVFGAGGFLEFGGGSCDGAGVFWWFLW